ncbi:ParB family protein [Xenorhabdus innexi]|nr:ParB family protein [Xenorhabdus innexi]
MTRQNLSLGNALLQQGRQAVATLNDNPPMAEMPMVLTLDQLRPNPDNPRTGRNPRYDDIKASIKARGLDTVPKVTRDPQGEDVYIFSDGGNTRYQVLSELWQETGDARFYRIHCLFKPWPGRLQCVIGHLAENELRGELSFIEKALGVCKARMLFEAQNQQKITQGELSALLGEAGFPVSRSYISRMEDTVEYLYPWMPNLLNAGLKVPQIRLLLALRQDAEAVWLQHVVSATSEPVCSFGAIFGACCRRFDAPETWSPEMFRDELIGDLLQALSHPQLNYDRWILELDPKESNRRQLFGEQATAVNAVSEQPEKAAPERDDNAERTRASDRGSEPGIIPPSVTRSVQTPETVTSVPDEKPVSSVFSGKKPVLPAHQPDDSPEPARPEAETLAFARTGLEPVSSVWEISPMQDDIDHLQNMVFRLAFELAETQQCENAVMPASDAQSVGYRLAEPLSAQPFALLLLSLSGEMSLTAAPLTLTDLLLGSTLPDGFPLLDDSQTVKFLRLIRLIRRLRELQRRMSPDSPEGP